MRSPGPRARHNRRYEPIAQIGRGGMAEVLLAMMDSGAGARRLAVLKRIGPELATDPDFVTMFLDEARLSLRLSHANVVQTYEVLVGDDELAIAMEYLDGQPLTRVLNRLLRGPGEQLGLPLRLRILTRVLAGLRARAHAGGSRRHAAGGRAPRRQPAERVRHLRRAGEAGRLRRGEDDRGVAPDAAGRHQGEAGVHGARAAAERGRRSPRGSVLGRRDAVGDAGAATHVAPHDGGRDRRPPRLGPADAGAARVACRRPHRARRDLHARARNGSGPPLPDGRGDGDGSRTRAGRRRRFARAQSRHGGVAGLRGGARRAAGGHRALPPPERGAGRAGVAGARSATDDRRAARRAGRGTDAGARSGGRGTAVRRDARAAREPGAQRAVCQ